MQTIPQITNISEFDRALRCLASAATGAYPEEATRITRGLAIASAQGVGFCQDGSTAFVQSASTADVVYKVTSQCECPDAARAIAGRCKHRWAKCLTKRALQALDHAYADGDYYAHLYEEAGILTQVEHVLYFVSHDAQVTRVTPDMYNYLIVLGLVPLADDQYEADLVARTE